MTRAPLILIVSQHEWSSRSLDSVIAPRGYVVLRAYTGQQALERAEGNDPDAVFVERSLPDMSGAELIQQLLERDLVSRAAPILLTGSGHVSRADKIAALEAGAWEILSLPVDAEELMLRIEHYIRGKLQADRLRDDALTDELTGLYSRLGVSRRISELTAAAERYGRPLSCVVLALSEVDDRGQGEEGREGAPAGEDALPEEVTRIAEQLRASVRSSDVLARIGPNEFAIVAPDTAPEGARVLAGRLQDLPAAPPPGRALRAGVFAVDDLEQVRLDPSEFLRRAARASRENRDN